MLPGILLLAMVWLLRRGRRSRMAALLLPAVLISSGCAYLSNPDADSRNFFTDDNAMMPYREDSLSTSVYAGAGLGLSRLEPDTSEVDGWDTDDRINNGGQVTIGVDVSKHFSAELHSADLGSAGLSPEGRINYHINGASALLYVGGNRHKAIRRGVTGYGRIGYGTLHNSPVGPVPFEKINAGHLLLGAGVEYMSRTGIGARAELISFDKDVMYGQLALIYRLGKKQELPVRVAQAIPEPVIPEPVIPEPVPVAAIPQPQVTYEPPPPPPPVAAMDPCVHVTGVLEGVNFHTDSAQLTERATLILDDVALSLARCRDVPIEISAHTDSVGDYDYNQALSQRRATSVVSYLQKRGIDSWRLSKQAFGESKPIDTNDTVDGRSRNRRVELIAR